VTIGAVWPETGPFAFAGEASLVGAELAADDINAAGGIASLCGAQVRLASYDGGASAEDAASAVETLLTDLPDVPVVLGSWLSSLTLSATEVTEREGIPWISDSFADAVTERDGFTHVYAVAPPSSLIKDLLLESVDEGFAAAGLDMQSVAIIGDNTAAAVPLQDALAAEFGERGIEVAVQEQWAPGLDDASGIATKIASTDVDAVFLISYAFSDVQLVVSALESRGVQAPIIQNGGQGLLPAWQELGDSIVGMSTFVTANPVVGGEDIAARLAAAAGESFARQDHLVGYFLVQVAAAAIDAAGTTDREAVNEALEASAMNDAAVTAAVATDEVRFAENGRIANPFGVLAQWQDVDGELQPCTVWPTEFAMCEPVWGQS
jgi:branched-chain amino acid transport system substrate-binding protein